MKIVFYDSYCGLCHFAIKLLISLDVSHQLKFAPIGGATFYKLIPEKYHKLDTVFLFNQGNISVKSDAIILGIIIARTNCFWLKAFLVIPSFIRNYFYDLIAQNRKRKSSCFIYSKDQDRFLP